MLNLNIPLYNGIYYLLNMKILMTKNIHIIKIKILLINLNYRDKVI